MKQLNELIVKLNNDELCAVDIYDKDLSKFIYRNFTNQKIAEQYKNSEDFFESLLESGHQNLTIQEKRKSGNSFKYIGKEFSIEPEIEPKENKLAMEKMKTKKKKKKKKKSNSGLNGLGITEMISLHTKADKVDELKTENKELKEETKAQKKEIERLKEEALLVKYTRENNDSRNKTIMTAIKEAPGILAGLGFKIPVPSAGLAGSIQDVEYEEFNENQSRLIDIVKQGDDSTNEILLSLVDKINEADETFATQFYNFLVIHKIVQSNG